MLTYTSFVVFMLLLSNSKWHFRWTLISFLLEKHGICCQSCTWIWIHNVCRGFNAQCNISILGFLHRRSWYGQSILDLVYTKWKQYTYLQTKCMILLMERNNTTTQIASSYADNYEEMKEGNYFIHIKIIILNFLGFKYWTQIDLFYFWVTFF